MSPMVSLFISMPYRVKVAALWEGAEAIEIDFDWVYEYVVKQSIPDGWDWLRADESVRTGPIDESTVRELTLRDVLLADITFGNPNVFFELGVRETFTRRGSVLIKHEGAATPVCLGNSQALEYPSPGSSHEAHTAFINKLKNALNKASESPGRSLVSHFLGEPMLGGRFSSAAFFELQRFGSAFEPLPNRNVADGESEMASEVTAIRCRALKLLHDRFGVNWFPEYEIKRSLKRDSQLATESESVSQDLLRGGLVEVQGPEAKITSDGLKLINSKRGEDRYA